MDYYCEECGLTVGRHHSYCPHCGVRFLDHAGSDLPANHQRGTPKKEREGSLFGSLLGLGFGAMMFLWGFNGFAGAPWDPVFDLLAPPEEGTPSITAALYEANDALDAADLAISEGRLDAARIHLAAAADHLARTEREVRANPQTAPEVHAAYERAITVTSTMHRALEMEIEWESTVSRQISAFETASDPAVQADALSTIELTVRSVDRLVSANERAGAELARFRADHRWLAGDLVLTADLVESHFALADELARRGDTLASEIAQLRSQRTGDYTEPSDTGLSTARRPTASQLGISMATAQLFSSFDANHDNRLTADEAAEFFYWVEDNIGYRYDDENATDTFPGLPVGDGREGVHYQQTPDETLQEWHGDCEDMNTLEVAFYNYWGIDAYQALVNAETDEGIDHAVAIVRVGSTVDELERSLEAFHYYTLEADNGFGIPAGVYLIVDNAYSSGFGYISGGIDPGKFRMQEVQSLGQALSEPVR